MDDVETLLRKYGNYRQMQASAKSAAERENHKHAAEQTYAAVLAAMRKGGVPDRERMAQALARTGIGFAQPAAALYEAVDAMLAVAPQPPALDRDGIIEACAVKGDEYAKKMAAKARDARTNHDEAVFESAASAGVEMAAAIRAMKVQK